MFSECMCSSLWQGEVSRSRSRMSVSLLPCMMVAGNRRGAFLAPFCHCVQTWWRLQASSELSSPFCTPSCVSPSQRKKICLLPPVTPLFPKATAVAGEAPLEKVGFSCVVRQVLLPKSCKEIQGGRAEVACVLMCH